MAKHWIAPVVISSTPQAAGGSVAQSQFDVSPWIPAGASAALVDCKCESDFSNTSGYPALVVYRALNDPAYYPVCFGVTNSGNTYGSAQGGIYSVPIVQNAVKPFISWGVLTPGFNHTFQFRLIGWED